MGSIKWLQEWFANQCDGDWEHSHVLSITTLDNPGWRISIDVRETDVEDIHFERIVIERSDTDWLQVWSEKGSVECAAGTLNLDEALLLIAEKLAAAHTA